MARLAFRSRFLAELACVLLALAATGCGPAQQATASPPQSSPLEFVGEWGMKGENPGELTDPVGIAVDLNARVYFADRHTGLLQKFEPTGVPSFAYSDPAVRNATAIAVDSGGAIYVADARAGRVWIHFPDGDSLRNFRVTPQRGPDAAFGFCVTSDGKIIVPDPNGSAVQVFTSGGRLESVWKLPPAPDGQLARPIAVATGLDDFVYVADAASGRIAKYTSRGAQVALWDAPADSATPLRGISVSRNHVFALRGVTPQLEVWNFDGRLELRDAFGHRFDAAPPAVLYFAVSRDEQVFLLDPARPRVFRFRLNLQSQ